ncbi:MAG TPA: PEP-CTERM sorting domain-containing protein [Chthoniobacterales bacterium]|jgi:hypothetical protein|nr:PEP-CTERM sorting domain-containing protein [Chthoniobacterales bacterium]
MKRMRRILFLGLCLLSSLTGVLAQEVLLGTTGGAAGDLYRIDPTTGVATEIGFLASGFNVYAVTGLAFDNVTGILYGSTSNKSASSARSLVAIDPSTGAVTFIGAFGVGSETMADLTFDGTTATLYGTGSNDGNLYSIDVTTGAATAVGSSGIAAASINGAGVAANSAGQIFGAPTGANQQLVQYNKTNGSVTTVATFSGAPAPLGSIDAMAFNAGGTLYGVDIDLDKSTHLVTIDTATGAVTDVGASVALLDAIVFFNPTAVPEPATLSLLGLSALGSFGLNVLRRHRRN